MAQSNRSAEDPFRNASAQSDRAARAARNRQLDRASQTAGRAAGRGKRSV